MTELSYYHREVRQAGWWVPGCHWHGYSGVTRQAKGLRKEKDGRNTHLWQQAKGRRKGRIMKVGIQQKELFTSAGHSSCMTAFFFLTLLGATILDHDPGWQHQGEAGRRDHQGCSAAPLWIFCSALSCRGAPFGNNWSRGMRGREWKLGGKNGQRMLSWGIVRWRNS